MAARACVFALTLLAARAIAPEFPARLVVWNVGQGQWVTLIDDAGCWHFDAGGERPPWREVMDACRARRNFLWLSHWDWDHVGFAGGLQMRLPDSCLLAAPLGKASARKSGITRRFSECGIPIPFHYWEVARDGSATSSKDLNSNDLSRIAITRGVLLPGDSSRAMEKFWIRELGALEQARVLVLGHHGSRTSTSKALVAKLRRTKLAIASARFRRYGHPHRETEQLLRSHKIPLLRTEDWGHILIEL